MLEAISGAATIYAELGKMFVDVITFNEPDFFKLRSAMRGDGAWLWGVLTTLLGGLLIAWIYRVVPWIERNLESTLMVVTYLLMSGRVFQNLFEDLRKYKAGEPMIEQAVLGGQ